MKRFYKLVSLQKSEAGHAVKLDGRPVRTPGKNLLQTPHKNLAQAVMEEWAAQGEQVAPEDMPLTQLLNTQIDRITSQRDVLTPEVLKYINTDLLCYHAPHPPELKARQEEIWMPHLQWFTDQYGEAFKTTEELVALTQVQSIHDKISTAVNDLTDDAFTVFQMVVPLSGSIILALAFVKGQADAEDVFTAMRIEEDHKAELYDADRYGPDPAQEKKDKMIQKELAAAQEYLNLTRTK